MSVRQSNSNTWQFQWFGVGILRTWHRCQIAKGQATWVCGQRGSALKVSHTMQTLFCAGGDCLLPRVSHQVRRLFGELSSQLGISIWAVLTLVPVPLERMELFCLQWKVSCLQWCFLLTVVFGLLAYNSSFFTYSWSFLAHS